MPTSSVSFAASPDADAIDLLRAVGREFHSRSWSLGTSSNYSVVAGRDPLELLVTVSGKDKSSLGRDDFVRVDAAGRVVDGSGRRSSAETLLHCTLAGMIPSVGAVLHTHSVWGTILSAADLPRGSLRIAGYEMLKGLDGIGTHDTFEEVPIFANTQDMVELSVRLRRHFAGVDWTSGGRPPLPWSPALRPRPLHLGPRPRRGPPAHRDLRVSVRVRGPVPHAAGRGDRRAVSRPAAASAAAMTSRATTPASTRRPPWPS
jgi:methylthioribulose-1-phosphate dehydratase